MESQHMTKDEAIHQVVSLAYSQVGYKEGPNNWNKYAADPRMTELYGWSLQNQPWCAVFVDWLFVESFGLAKAKEMIYGGSPACYTAASQYKSNNAWSMNPRKGDQIFYSTGDGHTGIVVDVSGSTITTIEGNWTDSVVKRTHFVGDNDIMGYGVPNWNVVSDIPDEEPPSGEALIVDGECGVDTWAALISDVPTIEDLPLVKYGATGWAVAMCQAMLNCLGANLDTDGECGVLTKAAIMSFQRDYNGRSKEV